MTSACGVAALLRPGGPVRVPLRECCVAALVGADGAVMRCVAAPEPITAPGSVTAPELVTAPESVTVPGSVTTPVPVAAPQAGVVPRSLTGPGARRPVEVVR
jgi:hypothetical protein